MNYHFFEILEAAYRKLEGEAILFYRKYGCEASKKFAALSRFATGLHNNAHYWNTIPFDLQLLGNLPLNLGDSAELTAKSLCKQVNKQAKFEESVYSRIQKAVDNIHKHRKKGIINKSDLDSLVCYMGIAAVQLKGLKENQNLEELLDAVVDSSQRDGIGELFSRIINLTRNLSETYIEVMKQWIDIAEEAGYERGRKEGLTKGAEYGYQEGLKAISKTQEEIQEQHPSYRRAVKKTAGRALEILKLSKESFRVSR